MATLAQKHPSYVETAELFRMSGTSMATAVASGVVALMLQAHPEWTPDQVKYRLLYAARPARTARGGAPARGDSIALLGTRLPRMGTGVPSGRGGWGPRGL